MRSLRSPPLAAKEWSTAEEISSDGSARDLDEQSEPSIGMRPVRASIRSPRPSGFKDDQVASGRSSIGRRIFGTLTRFLIVVLIGVGATLAWQSHGDEAREMLVAQAPSLGWLLSVSTTKSPAVIATSPDLVQQLGPLASNLDVVRRNLEQLAAKQEQMAQNIATLQAVEQDIREKVSSPPSSPAPQAASIPQRKPPQPPPQLSSLPRPPPAAGPPLPSR